MNVQHSFERKHRKRGDLESFPSHLSWGTFQKQAYKCAGCAESVLGVFGGMVAKRSFVNSGPTAPDTRKSSTGGAS